ncbi:MAG: glycosyl transferase, group 1 [uncultured bacterium]|nr:MAG: glycosyl transferase, group 1 [uncultured bacterium]
MQIGIDARFYGSIGKGLGRYTQKLIQHLEQIDNENQYVIFLRKENFDDYQSYNKNFKKVLADYKWYSFSEQIFFPLLLHKNKLDLVHFPHFNVPILYFGNFVLTIHDLILTHFPTLHSTMLNPIFYWIKYLAYKFAISSAVRRSQKILTVSEFTKNDLSNKYPESKNKIIVTYEACDDLCHVAKNSSNQVLEKYGIIKQYILYVGNAYPHKNLERLIESFELISSRFPDLRLALVGKEDFFYARLKKMVIEKNIANVQFLGFVSDQDLDVLYRFAEAYVFPSLYEGFGLPPLEAMAKGTAVVSSDHPCMREVLGSAAFYCDARNAGNFADGIMNILENQDLKQELTQRGYEQIKRYSWDRMAKETLRVYET